MAESERLISVVDVGAAAIDQPPPYLPLLKLGLCTVTGFEPQTDLWPPQSPLQKTFPDVIGGGRPGELRICRFPGMTSLYDPNIDLLESLGVPQWGEVVDRKPVQTRCLDDIAEIPHIDFLKIDAQGSEFAVIDGGRQKLSNAVCVQAEVSFVPLYRNQRLFGDIDYVLRRLGLKFLAFKWFQQIGEQITQADAIYVRDLTRMDLMSEFQLSRLADIAARCYHCHGIARRCREWLAKRSSPKSPPPISPESSSATAPAPAT